MNTETKHTPEALAAASAIRRLNTAEADTLLALFDTGREDREACEQIIIGKFAEVIDRETKLPDMAKEIAQLKADLKRCEEAINIHITADAKHRADKAELVKEIEGFITDQQATCFTAAMSKRGGFMKQRLDYISAISRELIAKHSKV